MKNSFLSILLAMLFLQSDLSFADCRGCCSGHGGVDCVNGITICKDGTDLPDNCKQKCDKCGTGAIQSSKTKPSSLLGNNSNDSFNNAKKILDRQIYLNHRISFYCGCPFDSKGNLLSCDSYVPKKSGKRAKKIEWEHIVPAAHFGQSFKEWRDGHPDCIDRKGKAFKGRNCASKVAIPYRYMESDMYNLVPAVGELNGLRSNFQFGMIPGERKDFGACDMEIDSDARRAEPPAHLRGDIARTYKYMDQAYPGHGIIGKSSEKLFNTWDKQDPVDSWECERIKKIEYIQGNENQIVKNACRKAGFD